MRILSFIIVLTGIVLFSSCSEPSKEKLTATYEKAKPDYELLKLAIIEDTKDRDCFEIGLDKIGEYRESFGTWKHRNDYNTKLSLSQVLSLVDLDEERFEAYKQLFEKTGSERVSYCGDTKFGPWISIFIHGSGISVSGCVGTIDWSQIMREPYGKRSEGHFQEVTTLTDGWYLVYSCT